MKHVTLERWLLDTYGNAVTLDTARRWIRAGKIQPPPEKHGARYFLHPEARYTDRPKLLDRLRAEAALTG